MCIAILNSNGVLSKEHLKNSWDSNPDGAGLGYFKDGKPVILKEMKSFEKFYKRYMKHRARNPFVPMLVHFRISTAGKIDKTNCHPFLINDEMMFCHNGILPKTAYLPENQHDKSSFISDTIQFNENFLQKHGYTFTVRDQILMGSLIGSGNKLIFVNKENKFQIVNEKAGEWLDGNWYSNSSYKPYVPYTYKNYSAQTTFSKSETVSVNEFVGEDYLNEVDEFFASMEDSELMEYHDDLDILGFSKSEKDALKYEMEFRDLLPKKGKNYFEEVESLGF